MSDHRSEVQAFYDEYGEQLGLTSDYEHLDEILPDVSGQRVLDAGCGLGDGTAYLAGKGADAVGIDISDEHIETAREKYGEQATFYRADIASGVEQLDAGTFDLVVCALTLAHIEDWDTVFSEFARLLDDSGELVVHAHHPFVDYIELELTESEMAIGDSATYTRTERFDRPWGPEGTPMPMYRRPLGEYLRPGLAAGFTLEECIEPGTGPFESERYDPERPPRHLLFRFQYRE
jgi:SAM-dependent methyltransferase